MRRIALVALAAPALLALQQAPGDVALTNASLAEVADAVEAAGGTGVRPGQWETRVEVLEMDMGDPSVQPVISESVKSAEPQVTTACVTPAQAKRPATEVFLGASEPECRYASYTLAAGRITAMLVCEQAAGTLTAHVAGTIAGDRFALDHESSAVMPTDAPEIVNGKPVFLKNRTAPTVTMRTRLHITGRRLGECSKTGE